MNKIHLTKKALADLAIPPDSDRYVLYQDAGVRGLGVKVEPSGHKVYFWARRTNKNLVWKTIGECESLTLDDARAEGQRLNTQRAEWKKSGYAGAGPFERAESKSLAALVDLYVEKHLSARAKNPAKAEKSLRWMIGKYLADWRERSLDEIRQEDVAKLHRRVGDKHGHRTANLAVRTLRTLYNFAAAERIFNGENPARGVRKGGIRFYPEDSRERFLQPSEMPRFLAALKRSDNVDLRDYVALALWTSARKSDVLAMRWADVSIDDNRWTVPNPKSRKPYVVALQPEAVEILRARVKKRAEGTTWVFPSSASASGHLCDLKRGWKRLLADAGVTNLRQHDVRRTVPSYMAAQGVGLPIIAKQLGHASTAATQVYARLDLSAVAAATQSAITAMRAIKVLPAAKKVARRG